jgi:two-component system, NtrC family, response regulator AtoC
MEPHCDSWRDANGGSTELLATDPRMLSIKDLAMRVAKADAPVLIMGESGTGKEVLARFIHHMSDRHGQAFVKVNCAAVPHELLESELFGHERGAFTGAHQRKPGRFEIAHQGSLLLDEIGDMSLLLQPKLLHVLEDWSFTRVGGTGPVHVDARIMATTNKPLDRAVADGEFRKDLYYRLKVIRFDLPPLRDRRADIPLLVEHFWRRFALRDGGKGTGIPKRLMEQFLVYHWPGNVRELKHTIQRYMILPDVDMVLSELMMGEEERPPDAAAVPLGSGRIALKPLVAQAAEEAEKRVILQVLDETHWNRRRAAARLDICYKTLLNKIHHWSLADQPRPASAHAARSLDPLSPANGVGSPAPGGQGLSPARR